MALYDSNLVLTVNAIYLAFHITVVIGATNHGITALRARYVRDRYLCRDLLLRAH